MLFKFQFYNEMNQITQELKKIKQIDNQAIQNQPQIQITFYSQINPRFESFVTNIIQKSEQTNQKWKKSKFKLDNQANNQQDEIQISDYDQKSEVLQEITSEQYNEETVKQKASSKANQTQINKSFNEQKYLKVEQFRPIGMVLYQKYILFAITLFAILSITSLPMLICNYNGSGFSELSMKKQSFFTTFIFQLSNANQDKYIVQQMERVDIQKLHQNKIIIVFGDICNICLIVIFIAIWYQYSENILSNHFQKQPQPLHFAFELQFRKLSHQIQNIQNGLRIYKQTTFFQLSQQQLTRHIQNNFKNIVQIEVIRNYSNFIHIVSTLVKHIKKQSKIRLKTYDQDKKKIILQKLYKEYIGVMDYFLKLKKKRFQEMEARNLDHEDFILDAYESIDESGRSKYNLKNTLRKIPIKSALVVCKTRADKQKICEMYNLSIYKKTKFQLNSVAGDYQLILKQVSANPVNINWQNYHFKNEINKKRKFFQIILLSFIIIIITVGLFLINVNKISLKHQNDHNHIANMSKDFSTFSQILQFMKIYISNQNLNQQEIIKIFCQQNKGNELFESYHQCIQKFSVQTETINTFLLLFFSFFIFLINLLTSKILRALVIFRRYKTVSEKDRFLIISMTLTSLINTAIILVVIRHKIAGPFIAQCISKIFPVKNQAILKYIQQYNEFNRLWHFNIGSQLISNFLMSLIIMPYSYLIMYWVRKAYRESREKKKQIEAEKKQLDYCLFYALSLKSYIFCLLFSGTMPIFYFLAFLSFIVQLIIRKIAMKRFLTQPVFLDSRANQILKTILPFGLAAHIVTSCVFFQTEDIFPNLQIYENAGAYQTPSIFIIIKQRLFVLVPIVLTIFLIIWRKKIAKYFCSLSVFDKNIRSTKICEKKIESISELVDNTKKELSHSIIQNIQQNNVSGILKIQRNKTVLGSYKMEDNPKYTIINYAMKLIQIEAEEIIMHNQQNRQKRLDELKDYNLF